MPQAKAVPKNPPPPTLGATLAPRGLPRLLPVGRAEATPGCPVGCCGAQPSLGEEEEEEGEGRKGDVTVGSVTGLGRVAGPSRPWHVLWLWAELPPSTPASITARSGDGRSWRNPPGAPQSLCVLGHPGAMTFPRRDTTTPCPMHQAPLGALGHIPAANSGLPVPFPRTAGRDAPYQPREHHQTAAEPSGQFRRGDNFLH